MTELQKQVLLGLIDGKTYSEIGREMGISRQAAHDYAQRAVRTGHERAERRIYYPNLRGWIYDNFRSVLAFSNKYGLAPQTIKNMLTKGRAASWGTIRRLCEITDMSAEELMAGGKGENVQENVQENGEELFE